MQDLETAPGQASETKSSEKPFASPAAPSYAGTPSPGSGLGESATYSSGPSAGLQPDPYEAAKVMSHWAEDGNLAPKKKHAGHHPRKDAGKPNPSEPKPTGDGELVLSSTLAEANEAGVSRYQAKVKVKIETWGLHFDPAAVHLGSAKDKPAILLKWRASWGDQPTTQAIPGSLAPIDARAAVHGVKQLHGYSHMEAGDQSILSNLLGGEANQLSAAARRHLAPQYHLLSTKTDAQQAAALKGVITGKDALPDVVDEKVSTHSTHYKLAGPIEKKDYAFRGRTADAEEWAATFTDGTKLTIIAPKAPQHGLHNHTVQQAAAAASYLPKSARAVINTIVLNAAINPDDPYWATEYHDPNFHSYMTAGASGVVTIYPDKSTKSLPNANYMRGTMVHETGHSWSYSKWGNDTTKGKWAEWKIAMDKDKVAVSDYAKNAIAEDVAETIQVYGTTKGTPRFNEYKTIVPHRFAILEQEYGK